MRISHHLNQVLYTQDLAAPLSQVLQTQVGAAAIISFAGRFAPVPPIRIRCAGDTLAGRVAPAPPITQRVPGNRGRFPQAPSGT